MGKTGDGYYAVAAAILSVEGEIEVDRKAVENIISHFGSPFKFSMHVERLDMQKMINSKLQ